MRYLALAAIVPAVLLAGGTVSAAEIPSLHVTTASAKIQPYEPGARGVTYNEKLAPSGATLSVLAVSSSNGSTVLLTTRGLLPKREYGAHVHVKPCGPAPADSGPHFQDEKDPVQPSVDPAYANSRNEIWLDFTTDQTGNGLAVARVPWGFGDREASSIVVHETHTHTDPGHAGTAGARLACLDADF
ncbi:superoxide dismutase family protein [Kibdelosporangium phytohabitans]|uniref:Superoxide dismutase n=1 Tax=Kibdelosporangium phytohabitans TaxID=860235 RepID=A0A0N7F4W2_9PSEU|nr:superoxide dismutase family protein [Kibdelosporangium phytohabitans]ALG12543.1 superoxide dismutase [Kibdelosporangium phytohabitans]MBE1464156.1 Cu-Zn family superoxide dismutase [Kibdelosporangium phytohabitans]